MKALHHRLSYTIAGWGWLLSAYGGYLAGREPGVPAISYVILSIGLLLAAVGVTLAARSSG